MEESDVTDEGTTEKLTAIVSEIDATLRGKDMYIMTSFILSAKQERQQMKDLNKQISLLKKQIKETQESLYQSRAEQDVLTYQLETSKKKNVLYEQDIVQAKYDGVHYVY